MVMVITDFEQALKLSQVSGRDAGERSRRNGNREHWNDDDWNAACQAQHDFLVMCGFAGSVWPWREEESPNA